QFAIGASHLQAGAHPPGTHEDLLHLARIVGVSGLIADIWASQHPAEATQRARAAADDFLCLTTDKLEPILTRTAAAMPQVAALFDFELGTHDEITRILEQANETLVMMTLKTSQQVQTAQLAIGTLEQKARDLEEASARDPLTGLYNRARLAPYLHEQVALAAQSGKPISVIMADVDHFKHVNDTYGHPAGDKILIAVAQALGGRLRPRDLAIRYGGEEFVLVLPETPAAGAEVVAERVRKRIEETTHDVGPAHLVRVTLSLGCATYP
ncbi:MAG: GGDEF domain-containing protein, partial [Pseudomonadota bacterium]